MAQSEKHIIYESNIDGRQVKCSCGKDNCKIGLIFDSESKIMMLTDKFGNEHAMYLNEKTISEIKQKLKDFKFKKSCKKL